MNLQIFKTQSLFVAMKSFFQELNLLISEVTEDPANPEDIVSNYFNLEETIEGLIIKPTTRPHAKAWHRYFGICGAGYRKRT
jgi:hypothetical protein